MLFSMMKTEEIFIAKRDEGMVVLTLGVGCYCYISLSGNSYDLHHRHGIIGSRFHVHNAACSRAAGERE